MTEETPVSIRRAGADDVEFLVALVEHEEVEPFLAAIGPASREDFLAEIDADPEASGRFVIEVGGERAGTMAFERVNVRSRIAHVGGLAVHPRFRGRRVADEAARLFQRHLIGELGFHRLQLEIYGFNERAKAHAERAGWVHEGVKRKAYWRNGEWVDGVLYGLTEDDLRLQLLHDHVRDFNAGVRSGDFGAMIARFAEDAELAFEGLPVGPFRGRDAIAAAYREQPPDDEVRILEAAEREDGTIAARYAWAADPERAAGDMHVTPRDGRIARLLVTFDRG